MVFSYPYQNILHVALIMEDQTPVHLFYDEEFEMQ